jgi:hypothetical protein
LHKDLLSVQIKQSIEQEGVEGLDEILQNQAEVFMEDYNSGDYQDSEEEGLASAVATKVKDLNLITGQPNP